MLDRRKFIQGAVAVPVIVGLGDQVFAQGKTGIEVKNAEIRRENPNRIADRNFSSAESLTDGQKKSIRDWLCADLISNLSFQQKQSIFLTPRGPHHGRTATEVVFNSPPSLNSRLAPDMTVETVTIWFGYNGNDDAVVAQFNTNKDIFFVSLPHDFGDVNARVRSK